MFSPLFYVCGQSMTQTIRGKVMDSETKSPLPGATVVLINSQPIKGSSTNIDGKFTIEGVPIGRQSLRIN